MKHNELPKFHETFGPILEILKNEETIHHRELLNKVLEKYYSDLPEALLEQKTKNGDKLIFNRIAWGKSYLKKGGFVEYPKRGLVRITKKGLNQRQELSLKDIQDEEGLFEFYKEENKKGITEETEIKNSSPQDLIDRGFTEIEAQVKSELLEKLQTLDPYYFEKVILILLQRMGYGDFIETSKSGDGGIDGIINEDKLGLEKIYIQAKRYNENKVRETDIRNFIGAMSGDTSKGVFVTTSTFDGRAITKAKDAHHSIILIDGSRLVDLLHEYGVGLQTHSTYELKELDEDFFEGQ